MNIRNRYFNNAQTVHKAVNKPSKATARTGDGFLAATGNFI
ncbi:hypothetical protein AAULR_18691 [Lacticaseibacillus rhamnosus MTCC 5462]|nr:hypothetical protein AAULR_18691 [Lacticaseibacillus rhamnosus MTCC 5462]